MSYSELYRTVTKEFTDNYFSTPVFYADTGEKTEGVPEWIRPNVIELDTRQVFACDDGSRRTRSVGLIVVQIFTKQGDVLRKLDLIDEIKTLWQYRKIYTANGFLDTSTSTHEDVGVEEGGYWQTNITTEYNYDSFN